MNSSVQTNLANAANWVSARDFAEAIQMPAVCFGDATLQRTQAAFDRLGMPIVTSGQFAYVFKLRLPDTGEVFAVRCFRAHQPDRAERYRLIDAHLRLHPVPALGDFRYEPEGISVGGRRFPVLVMNWITGHTLDVYIDEVIESTVNDKETCRSALMHLAGEWLKLTGALGEAGIAHGDLQHGNIIVEAGRLRLVDFDGMFVPALAGRRACEIGHQHFQHPCRDEHFFDAALDNFSALVIYVSLIALAERPALWREHHDENLIFTKSDFLHPASSPLFGKIKAMDGEPRRLVEVLEGAATGDPRGAPCLATLVERKSKLPAWMTAPLDVDVRARTREATRVNLPAGVHARDLTTVNANANNTTRSMPSTPASPHVQGLFGGKPVAVKVDPYAAPLDSSQLLPATFHYAQQAAKKMIWLSGFMWVIGFRSLTGFYELFGVNFGISFMLALLSCVMPFIVYGFARAYRNLAPGTTGLNLRAAMPAHLSSSAVSSSQNPTTPTPSVASVIAIRSQRTFHRSSCQWTQTIVPNNRIGFPSADAARDAGYQRCLICNP